MTGDKGGDGRWWDGLFRLARLIIFEKEVGEPSDSAPPIDHPPLSPSSPVIALIPFS
jgi:hypothetical protein